MGGGRLSGFCTAFVGVCLAACSQSEVVQPEGRASRCVDIPEGAYFQVINGRLAQTEAPVFKETQDLTRARLEAKFAGLGYPWLSLDWDGRIATLIGTAKSAELRRLAFEDATALIENDPIIGMRVEGTINSIKLEAYAEPIITRFSYEFEDLGLSWMRLSIKEDVGILTGLAPSASAKAEAFNIGRAAIANDAEASQVLKVVVDGIAVPNSPPPFGWPVLGMHDNPGLEACQGAFDDVMSGRALSFIEGQASIDMVSGPLLDALVGVALLCRSHQLDIEGHTRSADESVINLDLSQRRASAIRTYMTARGVPGAILTARGYGDTQLSDAATEDPGGSEEMHRTVFTVRPR